MRAHRPGQPGARWPRQAMWFIDRGIPFYWNAGAFITDTLIYWDPVYRANRSHWGDTASAVRPSSKPDLRPKRRFELPTKSTGIFRIWNLRAEGDSGSLSRTRGTARLFIISASGMC